MSLSMPIASAGKRPGLLISLIHCLHSGRDMHFESCMLTFTDFASVQGRIYADSRLLDHAASV